MRAPRRPPRMDQIPARACQLPGPDCRERLKLLCFAGSDLRDKERTEGLEKEGSSSKKAEMEHPRSSQETHEKSRLLPLL